LHFFYVNENQEYVTSTTPWNLLIHTPIMVAYYNAITGEGYAFEERHGICDPEWHLGQHSTIGTYYVSGLAASNYTLLSAIDADIQFAIASGVIRDEDLSDTISAVPDAGPYNTLWREGTNGNWRITTSTMPYNFLTYAQYNQWTGTTWQLTQMASGNFFNIYVVAVPAINATKTVLCATGQQSYTTLGLAQNATIFNDIAWGSMPFAEFSVIHKFTIRCGSSYGSSGKARIEAYADLRGTTRSVQVSGGASTTHNGLAGLNTGDYMHLTATEYSTIVLEAPIDGKQYARKNGGWVEVTGGGGGGGTMATVTGTLSYGTGMTTAQIAVSYPAITATTVISTIEYTDKLEEVLIQDMKIKEVSRTVGVGFTAMGYAPTKASGDYQFRAIIQE
jgi:hypothetical protein